MRIFRHTLSQKVTAFSDTIVLTAVALPSECRQNNFWGEVHVIGLDSVRPNVEQAFIYGVDGWITHIEDPDTSLTWDILYNTMIPFDKDVASGAFDLDTSVAHSGPSFEPGEPSIEALMDAANVDVDNHWYKRRKMLTYASHPRGLDPAADPPTWQQTDWFPIRVGRRLGVELMSGSMLAMTIPSMNDVSVTTSMVNTPAGDAEWIQIKYMEVMLEQAWMHLSGLTETGAETPWEDAAILVEDFVEPSVLENTAGDFMSINPCNTFTVGTFDITVPGRREFNVLTGEI